MYMFNIKLMDNNKTCVLLLSRSLFQIILSTSIVVGIAFMGNGYN